jgi:hypothetical protein
VDTWDEFKELQLELNAQNDMEDYCEVLKGKEATYYEDLAHFPEVIRLQKMKPDFGEGNSSALEISGNIDKAT